MSLIFRNLGQIPEETQSRECEWVLMNLSEFKKNLKTGHSIFDIVASVDTRGRLHINKP